MRSHVPVLEMEIIKAFQEAPRPVRLFFDGTFGRGGHTRAVFSAFPEVQVVALDHDNEAIEFGKENFLQELTDGRIFFIHDSYDKIADLRDSLFLEEGIGKFDIMLLDLGVSSPQLDQACRGFSFYSDGPLDMRMDERESFCAADIINVWSPSQLFELFSRLGEVRRPQRVIQAVTVDRKKKSFSTTRELASLIERVDGWNRRHHHPATKYFLALRLAVNKELEILEKALPHLVDELGIGGRLAIITFHSLEDRIAKYGLKSLLDRGKLVNKKVIRPTWDETKENSRARSAKLRIFERGEI